MLMNDFRHDSLHAGHASPCRRRS